MKAVGYIRALPIDDFDSLIDFELEVPVPSGRDLLVAVKAIAVNPVDTKVRASRESLDAKPHVIGWDAAGIVEAVGEDVSLFRPGDEVFYAGDITRPGCNSQFQLIDERIVGRKPASLTFSQAAALPLTAITAYEAIFGRLGLSPDGHNAGELLLIIGGAGGVGSVGIQLAKLAGLKVIATASRPASVEWVQKLGADYAIDHRQPLQPQVEALGFKYADHIALFNNTDLHWEAVTNLIRPQGKIVAIVENKGPLKQELLKMKSATLAWEFMFTRSMFQTSDMIKQHELLNKVACWIDEGRLTSTINEILVPINAANLRMAHRQIESGASIGKIVLEGWP